MAAVVKEPEDGKPVKRARAIRTPGPCAGCAERAAQVDALTAELGATGDVIAGLEARVFVWVGAALGVGLVAVGVALVALARSRGE